MTGRAILFLGVVGVSGCGLLWRAETPAVAAVGGVVALFCAFRLMAALR